MTYTMWEDPTASQYDVRLSSWEVAFEAAQEMMDQSPDVTSIEIMEYREAEVRDVCTHTLTDEVWDCMDDLFRDYDDLAHEDGWPVLGAVGGVLDERPKAWHRLRETLQDLIAQHLDLSEAAWQPTGRVRRVTHDGTSYQWEEISDAE